MMPKQVTSCKNNYPLIHLFSLLGEVSAPGGDPKISDGVGWPIHACFFQMGKFKFPRSKSQAVGISFL